MSHFCHLVIKGTKGEAEVSAASRNDREVTARDPELNSECVYWQDSGGKDTHTCTEPPSKCCRVS